MTSQPLYNPQVSQVSGFTQYIPQQPVMQQPVMQQPIIQQQPVIQQPVIQQPVIQSQYYNSSPIKRQQYQIPVSSQVQYQPQIITQTYANPQYQQVDYQRVEVSKRTGPFLQTVQEERVEKFEDNDLDRRVKKL